MHFKKFFIVALMFSALSAFGIDPRKQQVVSVAAQSSGKIIVLSTDSNSAYTLFRLNVDGSLDEDFATDGFYAFATNLTIAHNILVDADNTIIVAYNQNPLSYLQRFSIDGVPGTAVSLGLNDVSATSMCLDASGNIVVVGGISLGGVLNGFTMRYTSAFAADGTFNSGAPQTLSLAFQTDNQRCAIDGSGNILVAGQKDFNSAFLARYDSAGALDNSFGTSGIENISATQIAGIAVDDNVPQRILICGSNAGTAFLQRLNFNGAVDGTFTPSISFSGVDTPTNFAAVSVSTSNSVLVTGHATVEGINQLLTAKYTTLGAFDTSFHGVGYTDTDSTISVNAQGLYVFSNGSMIAYGSNSDGSLLVKYLANGTLDTGFSIGGYLFFSEKVRLSNLILNDNNGLEQAVTPLGQDQILAFSRQIMNIGFTSSTQSNQTTFTCATTGIYQITYDANIRTTQLFNNTVSALFNFKATSNGILIEGSNTAARGLIAINIDATNFLQGFSVSKTFLAHFNEGDELHIKISDHSLVSIPNVVLYNSSITITQIL